VEKTKGPGGRYEWNGGVNGKKLGRISGFGVGGKKKRRSHKGKSAAASLGRGGGKMGCKGESLDVN